MKVLLQRIREGMVTVEREVIGRAGRGVCLFLGVAKGDTEADADHLAAKAAELRIFEDPEGKMNLSLKDVDGEALIVSEFTLCGDCSRGRRPSFSAAAPPAEAERLYAYFIQRVRERGVRVATGKFQAKMAVQIVNDGPVTLMLESR
jgi:D-aminoacyl-tRNA deacylase